MFLKQFGLLLGFWAWFALSQTDSQQKQPKNYTSEFSIPLTRYGTVYLGNQTIDLRAESGDLTTDTYFVLYPNDYPSLVQLTLGSNVSQSIVQCDGTLMAICMIPSSKMTENFQNNRTIVITMSCRVYSQQDSCTVTLNAYSASASNKIPFVYGSFIQDSTKQEIAEGEAFIAEVEIPKISDPKEMDRVLVYGMGFELSSTFYMEAYLDQNHGEISSSNVTKILSEPTTRGQIIALDWNTKGFEPGAKFAVTVYAFRATNVSLYAKTMGKMVRIRSYIDDAVSKGSYNVYKYVACANDNCMIPKDQGITFKSEEFGGDIDLFISSRSDHSSWMDYEYKAESWYEDEIYITPQERQSHFLNTTTQEETYFIRVEDVLESAAASYILTATSAGTILYLHEMETISTKISKGEVQSFYYVPSKNDLNFTLFGLTTDHLIIAVYQCDSIEEACLMTQKEFEDIPSAMATFRDFRYDDYGPGYVIPMPKCNKETVCRYTVSVYGKGVGDQMGSYLLLVDEAARTFEIIEGDMNFEMLTSGQEENYEYKVQGMDEETQSIQITMDTIKGTNAARVYQDFLNGTKVVLLKDDGLEPPFTSRKISGFRLAPSIISFDIQAKTYTTFTFDIQVFNKEPSINASNSSLPLSEMHELMEGIAVQDKLKADSFCSEFYFKYSIKKTLIYVNVIPIYGTVKTLVSIDKVPSDEDFDYEIPRSSSNIVIDYGIYSDQTEGVVVILVCLENRQASAAVFDVSYSIGFGSVMLLKGIPFFASIPAMSFFYFHFPVDDVTKDLTLKIGSHHETQNYLSFVDARPDSENPFNSSFVIQDFMMQAECRDRPSNCTVFVGVANPNDHFISAQVLIAEDYLMVLDGSPMKFSVDGNSQVSLEYFVTDDKSPVALKLASMNEETDVSLIIEIGSSREVVLHSAKYETEYSTAKLGSYCSEFPCKLQMELVNNEEETVEMSISIYKEQSYTALPLNFKIKMNVLNLTRSIQYRIEEPFCMFSIIVEPLAGDCDIYVNKGTKIPSQNSSEFNSTRLGVDFINFSVEKEDTQPYQFVTATLFAIEPSSCDVTARCLSEETVIELPTGDPQRVMGFAGKATRLYYSNYNSQVKEIEFAWNVFNTPIDVFVSVVPGSVIGNRPRQNEIRNAFVSQEYDLVYYGVSAGMNSRIILNTTNFPNLVADSFTLITIIPEQDTLVNAIIKVQGKFSLISQGYTVFDSLNLGEKDLYYVSNVPNQLGLEGGMEFTFSVVQAIKETGGKSRNDASSLATVYVSGKMEVSENNFNQSFLVEVSPSGFAVKNFVIDQDWTFIFLCVESNYSISYTIEVTSADSRPALAVGKPVMDRLLPHQSREYLIPSQYYPSISKTLTIQAGFDLEYDGDRLLQSGDRLLQSQNGKSNAPKIEIEEYLDRNSHFPLEESDIILYYTNYNTTIIKLTPKRITYQITLTNTDESDSIYYDLFFKYDDTVQQLVLTKDYTSILSRGHSDLYSITINSQSFKYLTIDMSSCIGGILVETGSGETDLQNIGFEFSFETSAKDDLIPSHAKFDLPASYKDNIFIKVGVSDGEKIYSDFSFDSDGSVDPEANFRGSELESDVSVYRMTARASINQTVEMWKAGGKAEYRANLGDLELSWPTVKPNVNFRFNLSNYYTEYQLIIASEKKLAQSLARCPEMVGIIFAQKTLSSNAWYRSYAFVSGLPSTDHQSEDQIFINCAHLECSVFIDDYKNSIWKSTYGVIVANVYMHRNDGHSQLVQVIEYPEFLIKKNLIGSYGTEITEILLPTVFLCVVCIGGIVCILVGRREREKITIIPNMETELPRSKYQTMQEEKEPKETA